MRLSACQTERQLELTYLMAFWIGWLRLTSLSVRVSECRVKSSHGCFMQHCIHLVDSLRLLSDVWTERVQMLNDLIQDDGCSVVITLPH